MRFSVAWTIEARAMIGRRPVLAIDRIGICHRGLIIAHPTAYSSIWLRASYRLFRVSQAFGESLSSGILCRAASLSHSSQDVGRLRINIIMSTMSRFTGGVVSDIVSSSRIIIATVPRAAARHRGCRIHHDTRAILCSSCSCGCGHLGIVKSSFSVSQPQTRQINSNRCRVHS